MKLDTAYLGIDRLIIHEIPRHFRGKGKPEAVPLLSEIESPLDEDLKLFFARKIGASIGSGDAFEVVFDEDTPSPVPELVERLLFPSKAQQDGFVEASKQIALHLHESQTGISPGGLVTLVETSLQQGRGISILKIEKEEGARLRESRHAGRRTFDIDYLRDLFLTKRTKLFKVGFFYQSGKKTIRGLVFDKQTGYQSEIEVANFFLTTFLGCRLKQDPRISTKAFFNATQEFINANIDDPAKKAEAITHLLSELSSNRPNISVKGFAQEYLDKKIQKAFVDHLKEAGLTEETFRKDAELIATQTRKMAIEFHNEICIVGTPEAITDSVELKKKPDGTDEVTVTGKLRKVRPK